MAKERTRAEFSLTTSNRLKISFFVDDNLRDSSVLDFATKNAHLEILDLFRLNSVAFFGQEIECRYFQLLANLEELGDQDSLTRIVVEVLNEYDKVPVLAAPSEQEYNRNLLGIMEKVLAQCLIQLNDSKLNSEKKISFSLLSVLSE